MAARAVGHSVWLPEGVEGLITVVVGWANVGDHHCL